MCLRTTISLDPFSLYAHFIEGFWPCTWRIFFLYPRDLNIIKYNELRSLTSMMSTKSINFMTLPLPPSAKMNNRSKSIYCLKTIESTDTWILLRPPTSIPCGRHKFKVAYRIFHSSCDPSEKNSQLRHWL